MIFSTVDALIEAVGRTRARHWGDLDTLTCIWTGPSHLADTAPGMGATHPVYTNMEVNASRKISDVAGITRIQLDYVGLFDGSTHGPFIFERTDSESEIEYQEPHGPEEVGYSSTTSTDDQGNVTLNISVTWRLWATSTIIRYRSENGIVRYVAKNPGGPISGGASSGVFEISTRPGGTAASALVTQTFVVPPGGSISISGGPSQELYLGTGPWGFHTESYMSSFEMQAISPSWYRCRETWTTRYFAGA